MTLIPVRVVKGPNLDTLVEAWRQSMLKSVSESEEHHLGYFVAAPVLKQNGVQQDKIAGVPWWKNAQ